ncbi:hypothetical protein LPJ53_004266 [Coemansia erecta]|uniref:Membrane insertase YidC/Oxa/ALB C-terminal domain-containing protein n=1 Tax=Coemansia erecta TaxID=147472 RepID=A0A9W7XZC1_9FUNG|nr:hypothetical protein LPJ53_004266 [Coemansia erecta]
MSQAARFGVAFVARAGGSLKPTAAATAAVAGRSIFATQSRMLSTGALRSRANVFGGVRAVPLISSISARGLHSGSGSGSSSADVAPAAGDAAHETLSEAGSRMLGDASAAQIDPETATQAAMQIGDLARHGLDTFLPTRMMEYLLEYVHVTTGMPWWATIIATVVGIRALAFPFAARSQRHMAGVNRLKPETQLLTERQQAASRAGDMMGSARAAQELRSIYKRNGVSPWKGMGGNVVTLPFMMGMFFGLRDMASLSAVTHMHTGGLWWFTDLAVPDPLYILPALSCMGMMAVMELQSKLNSATEQSKHTVYGMRALGVAMAYFTCGLPADVFVFWITNNLLSFGQVALFHTKGFKEYMNIPDVDKVQYARKPESIMDKVGLNSLLGKDSGKDKKFVVKHKKI